MIAQNYILINMKHLCFQPGGKPVEIWTVGSIPIVNQILSIPKKGGKNPRAYCTSALPEAWGPISEDTMYGGGDVTLNKGYLVGRRIHKR